MAYSITQEIENERANTLEELPLGIEVWQSFSVQDLPLAIPVAN